MKFDINATLEDMLKAIKVVLGDRWEASQDTVNTMLKQNKERLVMLSDLLISGELTEKRFQSRLEDEKNMIIAQMAAVEIIGKATAQQAINAAIDVFQKAVLTAFKAIL